jgi:hypothetical protein
MDTFKKKSLYAALAGVGALGVTGAAQAVNVNPDGLGQALIYPYYTVRSVDGDAYNSLLSVVNSTASAKGVKVRFLEGKNSREVLDFNLYLSAFDVWTAAVVPNNEGGASVMTSDVSCTTPPIPAGGQPFVNFLLTDAAGASLDRTTEGYVEIIEMGDIVAGTVSETGVTHRHGVNNVPTCAGLSDAVISSNTVLGSGGLFGGMTLINVGQGTDFSVDAVALESFFADPFRPGALWAQPGSIEPTLAAASPATATVYVGGTAQTFPFPLGIDAVSAAIMHSTVMNEIVLDDGTLSGTDWVVTMPTKRFYVGPTSATPPFQRNFVSSGSCDDIGISVWDREERTGAQPQNFSPPQTVPGTRLCWEANIITWNASNVLGSANSVNINADQIVPGYQNGWARIDFTADAAGPIAAHQLQALDGSTFFGLPAVGFAVQTFDNNTRTNGAGQLVNSAFGGNFNHKYQRLISVPLP